MYWSLQVSNFILLEVATEWLKYFHFPLRVLLCMPMVSFHVIFYPMKFFVETFLVKGIKCLKCQNYLLIFLSSYPGLYFVHKYISQEWIFRGMQEIYTSQPWQGVCTNFLINLFFGFRKAITKTKIKTKQNIYMVVNIIRLWRLQTSALPL